MVAAPRSRWPVKSWILLACVALPLWGCSRSAKPSAERGAVLGEGLASFYGKGFDGRPTANGERFDKNAMTAAHRSLPFNACLRVRNLENGREVKLRVNDRGPYSGHRILDVSEGAARKLGMIERGVTRVRLTRC
jgi:rare lipoprotein A